MLFIGLHLAHLAERYTSYLFCAALWGEVEKGNSRKQKCDCCINSSFLEFTIPNAVNARYGFPGSPSFEGSFENVLVWICQAAKATQQRAFRNVKAGEKARQRPALLMHQAVRLNHIFDRQFWRPSQFCAALAGGCQPVAGVFSNEVTVEFGVGGEDVKD